MTTAQMATFIGRKGHVSMGSGGELQIEVWVTDMKERWGQLRYQVRPVAGFGRLWVERVNFPGTPEYATPRAVSEAKDSIGG